MRVMRMNIPRALLTLTYIGLFELAHVLTDETGSPKTEVSMCRNTYWDDVMCEEWSLSGQCAGNQWMKMNCELSCRACSTDANESFQLLLDEFYDYRAREFPEYATYVGYHNYDGELESFRLDAFDRRKNETERFLNRVKDLNPDLLNKENKRERRILMSNLQTFIDGYKWREYGALNSINFLEGLSRGPQWPMYSKLDTYEDFDNYLKRLAAVPKQINEQIDLMKRAIKLRRSSHFVSLNRVPAMLRDWNTERYFFAPFLYALHNSEMSDTFKMRMWDQGSDLLPLVDQALTKLKKFIDKDYSRSTRDTPGVHSLPQGLQYYEACLKWYLGYDVTADEVFELGVAEVDRIEKKIQEVMVSVDFHGNLTSFFKYIQNIPKFYNHRKVDLLAGYRELLDDVIWPKLDSMFYNVSIDPIDVVPVERDGPWGSYGQGKFYVNLKEPKKRSTFTMLPLTLHEAYPGHHYQDGYVQHHHIPPYRAQPINGRLYSVPFHFPVYSAYAEGWALYSEYLGHEMGLYEDPYDLFGRYVSEIFRACRLVVDTGIHAFNWSRQRAIRFLSAYSDFPLSQIESEVDRYITAPGQACSYKVGEIKIKHMRFKAQEALGDQFDIKEFHDQILKVGYVPLDILLEIVEEWVESKLTPEPSAEVTLTLRNSSQNIPTSRIFIFISCVLAVLWNSLLSLKVEFS